MMSKRNVLLLVAKRDLGATSLPENGTWHQRLPKLIW
jgi:hypothetical protein